MFNKKNLCIYLTGASLILTLNGCSKNIENMKYEEIKEDNIILDEEYAKKEPEEIINDESTEFESEEIIIKDETEDIIDVNEEILDFFENNKLSNEEISEIGNKFKEDFESAPDDFWNSVDALKKYFIDSNEEKIKVENYLNLNPTESSAYFVCKTFDDYTNQENYSTDEIYEIIYMFNSICFENENKYVFDYYTDEEKYYILLSASVLLEKTSSYILSEDFEKLSEVCTNEEFINYYNETFDNQLKDLTNVR